MIESVFFKEYEFNEPLIEKVDSIIDNCIRDGHDKYFHTFDDICEYNSNFTITQFLIKAWVCMI